MGVYLQKLKKYSQNIHDYVFLHVKTLHAGEVTNKQ